LARLAFLSAIATTPQIYRAAPRWTMSPVSHPGLPRGNYYNKIPSALIKYSEKFLNYKQKAKIKND